jgi:hypothetical protein
MATTIDRIRDAIAELPERWHGAGSVSAEVLVALQRHASTVDIRHSVETGTGKTTLLLSHLSPGHTVFTKDDEGDGDSLARVRASPLLVPDSVEFVIGPTQKTILQRVFTAPIQLALLDGPHAYPFPDLEYWAVYPHLETGAILVIDDLQIPTIANLCEFLRVDRMYDLVEVVDKTAFFRRTSASAIDPFGEGWWLQDINLTPATGYVAPTPRVVSLAKRVVPSRARPLIKRIARRAR